LGSFFEKKVFFFYVSIATIFSYKKLLLRFVN